MDFWAKTKKDGTPGVSVVQHNRTVGEIAVFLAEASNLPPIYKKYAPIFAGTHDVGKICYGFERKCPTWVNDNKQWIEENLIKKGFDDYESDHAKVSQWHLQERLGGEDSPLRMWAIPGGAHHGKVKGEFVRVINDGGEAFEKGRDELMDEMILEFGQLPTETPEMDGYHPHPWLWVMNGIMTVADWIGSDEQFFPADMELSKNEIRYRAAKALAKLGLLDFDDTRPQHMTFKDLFKFPPNDLQKKLYDFHVDPGSLVIIEGPMGCGKTEAALGLAYQMLVKGLANGLYFALPTQITSNRICERVQKFMKRGGIDHDVRLMHGSAWLETDKDGRDWFSSSKRSILKPFGVGTIDQAILGVMAVKHFFLRQYGLAGKVVILDEVHSYDLYTGTLIDTLIDTLRKIGATVVVLSATLSEERRKELIGAEDIQLSQDYPLVTISKEKGAPPIEIKAKEHRDPKTIYIEKGVAKKAFEEALEVAKMKGCVLWICNTVKEAQRVYRELNNSPLEGVKVGLLHAHFPHFRRQGLEDEWMGILGKDGIRPDGGCILVATQVVEQSVDIDADFMITELCPTDMLLQRMGRLWRHDDRKRPKGVWRPRVMIIMPRNAHKLDRLSEKEIKQSFGANSYVYSAYVLLRTWGLWKDVIKVDLPDDIRPLIEQTYTENENECDAWTSLKKKLAGEAAELRGKASMGTSFMAMPAMKDEMISTRHSEIPTVECLPITRIHTYNKNECDITLLDGTSIKMKNDRFEKQAAKAIHRNTIMIRCEKIEEDDKPSPIEQYLRRENSACFLVDGEKLLQLPSRQDSKMTYNHIYGTKIS